MKRSSLFLAAVAMVAGCGETAPSTPALVAMATALQCDTMVTPGAEDDGRIEAFMPGTGGRLAWTQTFDAKEIMLRDAAGTAHQVGRKGGGPGEFEWVALFGWHGDTLWASDMTLPRVQYFSASGEYLRGVTLPLPAFWVAAPNGSFLAFANKGIGTAGWAMVRADSTGSRMDTVYHFPGASATRVNIPIPGGALMATQPFEPDPLAAFSADGAWWCGTEPLADDDIKLRCVDAAGTLRRDTLLTLPARPITDSLYEGEIAGYLSRPGVKREDVLALIKRPAGLPRVNGILVDRSGAVWLNRSHSAEPAARWLRLRPDGALRDTLLVDARYRMSRLLDDTLWVTSDNADGAQVVSRCVAR